MSALKKALRKVTAAKLDEAEILPYAAADYEEKMVEISMILSNVGRDLLEIVDDSGTTIDEMEKMDEQLTILSQDLDLLAERMGKYAEEDDEK